MPPHCFQIRIAKNLKSQIDSEINAFTRCQALLRLASESSLFLLFFAALCRRLLFAASYRPRKAALHLI